MSSLILASNRARIRKESEARLSTGDASYQVIEREEQSSPRKTVLTSFHPGQEAGGRVREMVKERTSRETINLPKRPTRIEEVPFRRQDRRALNARYRRTMDRKLIICIVGSGTLLLGIGATLIALHCLFKEEYKAIRPFIVIGPVLIGGGVMTIVFSVEVCVRLYKANQRVRDPELDNLLNIHEVKHWMDPQIIPYGWGLFSEGEEVIVVENEDGEEEGVKELVPPLAVTGLLVKPTHLVELVQCSSGGSCTSPSLAGRRSSAPNEQSTIELMPEKCRAEISFIKTYTASHDDIPERLRTQIYFTRANKPSYA